MNTTVHVIALFSMVLLLGPSLAAPSAPMPNASEPSIVLPPVILFHDTGINPYHIDYRLPADFDPAGHPDYYPQEATLLEITLDAASFDDALEADQELWGSLESGVLYAFNGTRIVGAIKTSPCDFSPCILDRDGHGSVVASAAAGVRAGSCPECRIVMYQLPRHGPTWMGWAHELPWIDAVSSSLGNALGVGRAYGNEASESNKWTDSGRPWFVASGNGVGGGAANHLGDFQGPPWTFNVGRHPLQYHWTKGFDVVASAEVEVARHNSLDEYWIGGGTSTSAPHAAGYAMMIVWQAREMFNDAGGWRDGALAQTTDPDLIPPSGPLSDGRLTGTQLEDLLRATAQEVPLEMFNNLPPEPIPHGPHSYWFRGFGLVDDEAMMLADAVLRGEEDPPEKPWEWWWHEIDQYSREWYAGWIPYCTWISDPLAAPGCIVSETPDLTESPSAPPV